MGYTALDAMREKNRRAFGIPFPVTPKPEEGGGALETACIRFLREQCEGLRFDPEKAALDDRDGRSAAPGQIPLNMEKDVDRLCLENALRRFLRSGAGQDAFDVYFCWLEMFWGGYGRTRKMIELLAEFETNASALLMKHRDHYAHSVYVFALGLAVFSACPGFRETYGRFYGLDGERSAAHHFLRCWGLTALFHDIGYPFELPFDEVKSYFCGSTENVPFLAYKGMAPFLLLTEAETAHFRRLFGKELPAPTIDGVLAGAVASRLGSAYGLDAAGVCRDLLDRKAVEPEWFGGFMDHAYFSAVLLFRRMAELLGAESIGREELDCLSAIVLHNSLFKFSVRSGSRMTPLEADVHPLAWLLMLCDELQCWDRTAYGQNTRQELHPMGCDLRFSADGIAAVYLYDRQLEYKKDTAKGSYRKMAGTSPVFTSNLEGLVRLNGPGTLTLTVGTRFEENTRPGRAYLSRSSFLHLYQFAAALNARYAGGPDTPEKMEADFAALSLEYKLSNILQAKAFARYLDAVGCFYTDAPAAYPLLKAFTAADMDVIGPMEHSRWLEEKRSMGWTFGDAYKKLPESRIVRELTRTHCLMTPDYGALETAEQRKDTEPMNTMLRLIGAYDGLRIYRL